MLKNALRVEDGNWNEISLIKNVLCWGWQYHVAYANYYREQRHLTLSSNLKNLQTYRKVPEYTELAIHLHSSLSTHTEQRHLTLSSNLKIFQTHRKFPAYTELAMHLDSSLSLHTQKSLFKENSAHLHRSLLTYLYVSAYTDTFCDLHKICCDLHKNLNIAFFADITLINWLEVKDALVNIVQSPTDCKCNIFTIMLGVTDTDRTKKQQPSSKQWENYLWRTYKSNLSSNTYKQLLTLQLWIIFLMIFRINHYNAMDKTEV